MSADVEPMLLSARSRRRTFWSLRQSRRPISTSDTIVDVLAWRASVVLALSLIACAPEETNRDDDPVGETSLALNDSDPVSAAVDASCTTSVVKGLSTQLVEEIQCLRPGTMKNIDGVAGLQLGTAVFPWLQMKAAEAVTAAQKDRGVLMEINSALRTLPQQYLLYRWYQKKRCNIGLAARPGQSNHESGLAVDIEDNAAWRDAMTANEMRWLGASDPMHFDYVGEGRIDLGGLSVLAFQKLWNRNHPEDPIAEDSTYGDETEKRLSKSPAGGFPKGAECTEPAPGAPPPTPPPSLGDEDANAPQDEARRSTGGGDGGCAMGDRQPDPSGALLVALVLVGASTSSRRRDGYSSRLPQTSAAIRSRSLAARWRARGPTSRRTVRDAT